MRLHRAAHCQLPVRQDLKRFLVFFMPTPNTGFIEPCHGEVNRPLRTESVTTSDGAKTGHVSGNLSKRVCSKFMAVSGPLSPSPTNRVEYSDRGAARRPDFVRTASQHAMTATTTVSCIHHHLHHHHYHHLHHHHPDHTTMMMMMMMMMMMSSSSSS